MSETGKYPTCTIKSLSIQNNWWYSIDSYRSTTTTSIFESDEVFSILLLWSKSDTSFSCCFTWNGCTDIIRQCVHCFYDHITIFCSYNISIIFDNLVNLKWIVTCNWGKIVWNDIIRPATEWKDGHSSRLVCFWWIKSFRKNHITLESTT
jgi:hypothetical protein